MLMDLMVVITYIKPYDKRIGEKNHIPNKQENLNLRAKNINNGSHA